ncbi:MAG: AAA family ATPase [Candidatus Thorarchaeota archaeon]|jgi:predicted ATPase
MKKIVLTGAPHSGKTTLINELLGEGYLVVPETAITVIDALSDLLGPDGALKWRRNHFKGFQELISERQFYMEHTTEVAQGGMIADLQHHEQECYSPWIFLDRGAHDGIAFARHFRKEFPEKASKYIEDARYDQVFLLDLVLPFDDREGTGRIETVEDCHALQQHLFDIYSEIGLEPIVVPVLPLDERMQFILERVVDE